MRDASPIKSAALPLPLAREVEATYQRFESAWQAGQRPAIEDHLGVLPGPAWTALLGELLELELSYRRRAGEIVRPEEFRQRFPEHAALIESVFRDSAARNQGTGDRGQEPVVRTQGSEPSAPELDPQTPDSY